MKNYRKALVDILMLALDNEHTSASTCGLNKRAVNRKTGIDKMLKILDLSEEKAEKMYWNWKIKKEK